MNAELLRHVDGIARDKNIDRELIYADIEQAIASGLRKHFNVEEASEFQVTLDRTSGAITASRHDEPIPLETMGRIGAQTVKQVMIQLIRQDERGSIYDEFMPRVGTIVTGTVARIEGVTIIVNLGRAEGIMPRAEQIPGEHHEVGERIQALITEVRDTPSSVKIILSRTHERLIRCLFEREVPEVGERTIEIKALAREPGHRTKIAVTSIDAKVDAVGACVGVRGSRIKNIVEELGGEKIDIVRWNESSQILISNALKPAEVAEVSLCFELGRATVVVKEDQLSLAIGKRGQNVRLAARLTGWDIDILTPPEFSSNVERLERTLNEVEGMKRELIDKIVALGLIDVRDIEEVGEGPLMEDVGMDEDLAERTVDRCIEEAKIVIKEVEAKKKADDAVKAAQRQAMFGPVGAAVRAQQNAVPDLLSAIGVRSIDAAADGGPADPQSVHAEANVTEDAVANDADAVTATAGDAAAESDAGSAAEPEAQNVEAPKADGESAAS